MTINRKGNIRVKRILFETENSLPPSFSQSEITKIFTDMIELQQLYNGAIREISSKLETLDEEFQILYSHNPIHHIESRLKAPRSIIDKLIKRNFPVSIESAMENITDIAGIRVICHYIDDVYTVEKLITEQSDVTVIKKSDYIEQPKPNGYRSLHIIASVPVYLSKQVRHVPVEIQLRTIAMDFWASLEHKLRYKSSDEIKDDLQSQLKECAEQISLVDSQMQEIHEKIYK